MIKESHFIEITDSQKIWAIGSIHSRLEAFNSVKKYLLENFGKTALTVLSGYGIGADTAARVLRNMIDEEDYLYKQIIAEERKYALNRGFWDS